MNSIGDPSLRSLFLELREAGTAIGTATGFVVQRNGVSYLITNQHVMRSEHPPFPDGVVVKYLSSIDPVRYLDVREPLYDHLGEPLWLEHPRFGRQVDVAALPLTRLDGVMPFPVDVWAPGPFGGDGFRLAISEPLNIVGFPFGQMVAGGMGVWVRGFVATEPGLDWDGLPAFLIDSRTRPGQSGSPVLAFSNSGTVALDNGDTVTFTGWASQFFGVYSGRIHDQSDLGIVWKKDVLGEIISANRRATRP